MKNFSGTTIGNDQIWIVCLEIAEKCRNENVIRSSFAQFPGIAKKIDALALNNRAHEDDPGVSIGNLGNGSLVEISFNIEMNHVDPNFPQSIVHCKANPEHIWIASCSYDADLFPMSKFFYSIESSDEDI